MWLLPSSPNSGHLPVVHHVSGLPVMKPPPPPSQKSNSFPVEVRGSRSPGQLGFWFIEDSFQKPLGRCLGVGGSHEATEGTTPNTHFHFSAMGLLSQALWIISPSLPTEPRTLSLHKPSASHVLKCHSGLLDVTSPCLVSISKPWNLYVFQPPRLLAVL